MASIDPTKFSFVTDENGRQRKKPLPGTAWKARWRTPSGRSRAKTFARKVDAERYLTTVEHSKMTGSYTDPAAGRLTVAEWANRWMASRVHLKAKTIASYESLLRSRVLPALCGDVPLQRLTNGSVVSWVADMRAGGLSAQRTRHAYHVLKAMLDAAVADNRLARNPAGGVKLPRLPAVSSGT